MNVTICDFEDSFTYNIFSELNRIGVDSNVVSFSGIKEFLQKMMNTKDRHVIILGPGPGHPSEYLFLQETILNLMKNPNVFIFGICLGHQLLWYFQGHEISHCKNPIHGKVEHLKLDKLWKKLLAPSISVQRYNSLAVKLSAYEIQKCKDNGINVFLHEGECKMSYGKNFISYQFHPESIGTNFPELFFRPIKKFLI